MIVRVALPFWHSVWPPTLIIIPPIPRLWSSGGSTWLALAASTWFFQTCLGLAHLAYSPRAYWRGNLVNMAYVLVKRSPEKNYAVLRNSHLVRVNKGYGCFTLRSNQRPFLCHVVAFNSKYSFFIYIYINIYLLVVFGQIKLVHHQLLLRLICVTSDLL